MKKDYEIGYGKPPVAAQFSKGMSGNPKGRPRKHPYPNKKAQHTTSIVEDVLNELQQVVTITEAGKTKKITKQQALVKSLYAQATKGDSKAVSLFLTVAQDHGSDKIPEDRSVTNDDGSVTYTHTITKEKVEELEAWVKEPSVYQDPSVFQD